MRFVHRCSRSTGAHSQGQRPELVFAAADGGRCRPTIAAAAAAADAVLGLAVVATAAAEAAGQVRPRGGDGQTVAPERGGAGA